MVCQSTLTALDIAMAKYLTSKEIDFSQQFGDLTLLVLLVGSMISNGIVESILYQAQTMFGQLMAIVSYSIGVLKYTQGWMHTPAI